LRYGKEQDCAVEIESGREGIPQTGQGRKKPTIARDTGNNGCCDQRWEEKNHLPTQGHMESDFLDCPEKEGKISKGK